MIDKPNDRNAINAYRRAYRIKNREKLLAQAKALRQKFPERHRAYEEKWRSKNRDRILVVSKAWRIKNKEKIKRQGKEWREKNKEHRARYMREQQLRKSEMFADNAARRRAKTKNATPEWSNKFYVSEAYHLAKLRTKMLGFNWHVDHIVPLQSEIVCGLHVENNLRVIPASENHSKNNRQWPDMP